MLGAKMEKEFAQVPTVVKDMDHPVERELVITRQLVEPRSREVESLGRLVLA